jgi:hypothetical protein
MCMTLKEGVRRRSSRDIAFACYFYKLVSCLCLNHVRCSRGSYAVRGMIREAEVSPVGDRKLFPCAMCHLSGGTICFDQRQSTIRIVGGAVQTSLPVAG